MSVGFYITFIGLLTHRCIEQTPYKQQPLQLPGVYQAVLYCSMHDKPFLHVKTAWWEVGLAQAYNQPTISHLICHTASFQIFLYKGSCVSWLCMNMLMWTRVIRRLFDRLSDGRKQVGCCLLCVKDGSLVDMWKMLGWLTLGRWYVGVDVEKIAGWLTCRGYEDGWRWEDGTMVDMWNRTGDWRVEDDS